MRETDVVDPPVATMRSKAVQYSWQVWSVIFATAECTFRNARVVLVIPNALPLIIAVIRFVRINVLVADGGGGRGRAARGGGLRGCLW